MANDVNVTEIDVLKAYSRKLHELCAGGIAVAIRLDCQLHKIQEDYENRLHSLQRLLDNSVEDYKAIQSRYQSAITACGEESRDVIGYTDIEAQSKVEAMRSRVAMVRNNIQRLQTLLQNAGNKTKNYQLQMNNMTDNCRAFIKRETTLLEQYKDLKK